jgi:class 3 adenylate cyclase
MERRLAAILAADVVGYSRLIRADEEGAIAALQNLRSDLIDPKIAEPHGRIVKLMGDSMCPSSKSLGLVSLFSNGGSGSSWFDGKPLVACGSSGVPIG